MPPRPHDPPHHRAWGATPVEDAAAVAAGEQDLVAPPGVVAGLKQFSDRYPTMEAILGQNADFYFAGWQ